MPSIPVKVLIVTARTDNRMEDLVSSLLEYSLERISLWQGMESIVLRDVLIGLLAFTARLILKAPART